MLDIPEGFRRRRAEIRALVRDIPGLTTRHELDFLALLAACPTTSGEMLEIGSFRGLSTAVLSLAASIRGDGRVVAVDPLIQGDYREPDSDAEPQRRESLLANLARCGVSDKVEFHQTSSSELAKRWDRKLRLLWIDGLHTYQGAKTDFDLFAPHLSDGAVVAMHDVRHLYPGPARVFAEDILLSEHFGACGLCRSIGWAQYRTDPAATRGHEAAKSRLYRRLAGLIPYMTYGRVKGLRKMGYNWRRNLIPHGPVNPRKWLRSVDFVEA